MSQPVETAIVDRTLTVCNHSADGVVGLALLNELSKRPPCAITHAVKACPHQATKLPKTTTNCCHKRRLWQVLRQCCRFRQQFVAWCGQAFSRLRRVQRPQLFALFSTYKLQLPVCFVLHCWPHTSDESSVRLGLHINFTERTSSLKGKLALFEK